MCKVYFKVLFFGLQLDKGPQNMTISKLKIYFNSFENELLFIFTLILYLMFKSMLPFILYHWQYKKISPPLVTKFADGGGGKSIS